MNYDLIYANLCAIGFLGAASGMLLGILIHSIQKKDNVSAFFTGIGFGVTATATILIINQTWMMILGG